MENMSRKHSLSILFNTRREEEKNVLGNIVSLLDNLSVNSNNDLQLQIKDISRTSDEILWKFHSNVEKMQAEFQDMLTAFKAGTLTSKDFEILVNAEHAKGYFSMKLAEEMTKFLNGLFARMNSIVHKMDTTGKVPREELGGLVNILDESMETLIGLSRVISSSPQSVASAINTTELNRVRLANDPTRGYFASILDSEIKDGDAEDHARFQYQLNRDFNGDYGRLGEEIWKADEEWRSMEARDVHDFQRGNSENEDQDFGEDNQVNCVVDGGHSGEDSGDKKARPRTVEKFTLDSAYMTRQPVLKRSSVVIGSITSAPFQKRKSSRAEYMQDVSMQTESRSKVDLKYCRVASVHTRDEDAFTLLTLDDTPIHGADQPSLAASDRQGSVDSAAAEAKSRNSSFAEGGSDNEKEKRSAVRAAVARTPDGQRPGSLGRVHTKLPTIPQGRGKADDYEAVSITAGPPAPVSPVKKKGSRAIDKLKKKVKSGMAVVEFGAEEWMEGLPADAVAKIKKKINHLTEKYTDMEQKEERVNAMLVEVLQRKQEVDELEAKQGARGKNNTVDMAALSEDLAQREAVLLKKEQTLKLQELSLSRRSQQIDEEIEEHVREVLEAHHEEELSRKALCLDMETQTESMGGDPTFETTAIHHASETIALSVEEEVEVGPVAQESSATEKPEMTESQVEASKGSLSVSTLLLSLDVRGLMRITSLISSFLAHPVAQSSPGGDHHRSEVSLEGNNEDGTVANCAGQNSAMIRNSFSSQSDPNSPHTIRPRTSINIPSNRADHSSPKSRHPSVLDLGRSMLIESPRSEASSERLLSERSQVSSATDDTNMQNSDGENSGKRKRDRYTRSKNTRKSTPTIIIYPVNTVHKSTSCSDLFKHAGPLQSESLNDSSDELFEKLKAEGHDAALNLSESENRLFVLYEVYRKALPAGARARLLQAATGELGEASTQMVSKLFSSIYEELCQLQDKIFSAESDYGSCQNLATQYNIMLGIMSTRDEEGVRTMLSHIHKDVGELSAETVLLQLILTEFRNMFDFVAASEMAKVPKLLVGNSDFQKSLQMFQDCHGKLASLGTRVAELRGTIRANVAKQPGLAAFTAASEINSDAARVLQEEFVRLRDSYEVLREDRIAAQDVIDRLQEELLQARIDKDHTPGALLFFSTLHNDGIVPNLQQLILQLGHFKDFVDGKEHIDFPTLRRRLQVCVNCLPSMHQFVSRYKTMHNRWIQDRLQLFHEGSYSGGNADDILICPLCRTDTRREIGLLNPIDFSQSVNKKSVQRRGSGGSYGTSIGATYEADDNMSLFSSSQGSLSAFSPVLSPLRQGPSRFSQRQGHSSRSISSFKPTTAVPLPGISRNNRSRQI